MEKSPQNTSGALLKLEREIEELRLQIGDAQWPQDDTLQEELLKKRLAKLAEYKALGGSNPKVLD